MEPVTDIVHYNADYLNFNDLPCSFFHTSRLDPTQGFEFDATVLAGHAYPSPSIPHYQHTDALQLHLCLASHFALHLRHQLEQVKGYTSAVGVSTSRLLSKLVGNLTKPRGQTTLLPPYETKDPAVNNIFTFMDSHNIASVPGIGFKTARRIRHHLLGPPSGPESLWNSHLGSGDLTVGQLRLDPRINADMLERLLSGPGSPHGIGAKVFALVHGIDDSDVQIARNVPRQISIEDSYVRLDTLPRLVSELDLLASKLVQRMRIDLLEDQVHPHSHDTGIHFTNQPQAHQTNASFTAAKRWISRPETLRLTTRPRLPLNADGTRTRTFKRISRSMPVPAFIFNLQDPANTIASRLVHECLLLLFRRLHPEPVGWNLSLLNIAVTHMSDAAGDSKLASGRDIQSMFTRKEPLMNKDMTAPQDTAEKHSQLLQLQVHESHLDPSSSDLNLQLDDDWPDQFIESFKCQVCDEHVPMFAMQAHERFHDYDDTLNENNSL